MCPSTIDVSFFQWNHGLGIELMVLIIIVMRGNVDDTKYLSSYIPLYLISCFQTVYGAGPLLASHWDSWERLRYAKSPEWDSDCECHLGVSKGEQESLYWPGSGERHLPLCLLRCEYDWLNLLSSVGIQHALEARLWEVDKNLRN